MPRKIEALSAAQVRILKYLNKCDNLKTRKDISEGAEVPYSEMPANLGPDRRSDCEDYEEKHGRKSLMQLGFLRAQVQPVTGEDGVERTITMFCLTEKGEQAADTYRTKALPKVSDRVPKDLLRKAVLKIHSLRTYGIEDYTDNDMKEIKADLPEQYQHIPLTTLKTKAVNLRKAGGLKQDQEQEVPSWYVEYRDGEHFKDLENTCLERWGHSCAFNPEHDASTLTVIHRHYNSLGNEKALDLIPVCKECMKRARKSFQSTPLSYGSSPNQGEEEEETEEEKLDRLTMRMEEDFEQEVLEPSF